MLKNVLIVVGLLLIFNAAFVFLGGLDLLVKTEQKQNDNSNQAANIRPEIVDLFRETLENEVNKNSEENIESFEPDMFLAIFPGMVKTDFSQVDTRIGYYVIKNGQIEHDLGDPSTAIHGEAKAINRNGYAELLKNISVRTGINLDEEGTITDIMDSITAN